jgi:hypothetical protein
VIEERLLPVVLSDLLFCGVLRHAQELVIILALGPLQRDLGLSHENP